MDERTTTSKFISNAAAKSAPKDGLKLKLNWAGRAPRAKLNQMMPLYGD